MNKKRTSIFIVTLLLFSMVLTGCGTDTVGFLNHVGEMQKISTNKATQTVSTISISDINLPIDIMDAEQKQIVQAVTSFLDDYYITITQTMHPEKDITSMSFDIIKKLDRNLTKENLLTINYKDEAFAISPGPKLAELPLQVQAMIDLFADQLIPLSVFEELLGNQAQALSMLSNREGLLDLNQKSMSYLKDFIKIYKTMDTKVIIKDPAYGGSFLFQMNTPELAEFINEFVSISLQNTDAILNTTTSFFESLTEEEFNMLYGQMMPNGKAEMIMLLKATMEEPIPEEIPEMWNQIYDAEIKPLILDTMKGSSISMRTWKDNNNYYTNLYGVFKITLPGEPNIQLSSTLLIKEELTTISDDFDIVMPTIVIPDDLLKSILPIPLQMEETLDDIAIPTI